MAIEIAFETSVDVADGGKSLKSLKQEFRDTQKELDGVDVGTKKYIETLKKLGKIKDEIEDLNNTIKVFNPEAKMQAFGNVMGGVASGIQGAVGAMALFGIKSKDTEKMLLKVQAASAFAEGIKGVMGLGDAFKDFQLVLGKTAIGQKLVTAGQWLWNAAITANPIGAIIIALSALVAGIGYFISNTNDAADVQEKLNKKLTAENEAIQKGIDLLDLKNSKLNQANQDAVALMQAQGASEAEVLAFKLKALDDEEAGARKLYREKLKIYNNDKEVYEGLRKLKKDSSDEDDIKELADEKAKLDAKFIETTKLYDSLGEYKIQGDILVAASETKDRNDRKESNAKAAKDKEIADKAAIATSIEDREAGEAAWKQLEEQINQDTLDRLKDRIKKSNELEINSLKLVEDANADSELKKIALAADRKEEILRQTYEQSEKTLTDFDNLNAGLLAIDKETNKQIIDNNKETNKQIIDNNKKTNDTKTADDKAALALKKKGRDDDIKNALLVTQSLQNISDIYFTIYNSNLKKGSKEQKKAAEDQFNINKALNLATATITGVKTVMDAYEAGTSVGGPYALATGAAYAAAAGIAVAAQLVKIASTDFDSGSSSGVDTSSFASTPNVSNVTAPTINNPNSGQTSLNPDGTINNGQPTTQPNTPTVRAYVVETEITSVQARIGRISSHAIL